MSLATAVEYALMLTAAPAATAGAAVGSAAAGSVAAGGAVADPAPGRAPASVAVAPGAAGLVKLSPRERELVTLVARGRTDAQIAAQMYITVRTVSTHLDRIRDKTGCRRRADLTRLALSSGLV
jgi:DNA-binding CsgD family transcriptional regulator